MSYLDPIRLHFAGQFQADVSTVNNTATHFDNVHFDKKYQRRPDGLWNPDGSGSWRLVGCEVTRVCYADGSSTTDRTSDPVVGMSVMDANERVAGKLVDLDPEQQMVSMIFGMLVRLTDGAHDFFAGPYEPAAFFDLWRRAATDVPPGAQAAGATYQSVIGPVRWGETKDSRFLRELRAAAAGGMLSIKFNVDAYDRSSTSPTFTYGRLVGSIGPAHAHEPHHLVVGRHLGGDSLANTNFMPCVVDRKARRITADFGNSIPTKGLAGPPVNLGPMALGYLDSAGKFAGIGDVPYSGAGWYESTAGVVSFPLDDAALAAVKSQSVAVSIAGAVAMQENVDGTFVRADQFVFRLSPGDTAKVDLWAMKYGELQDDAPIVVQLYPDALQDGGPPVATPDILSGFDPKTPIIARHGRATLHLKAGDPKNPRGYIDGQVYGVQPLPPSVAGGAAGSWASPFDFISLLVWNAFDAGRQPVWYGQMQPIFTQYGNLYPLMDTIIDLTSYDAIAANVPILEFVFNLPVSDPNSMPVTRDLSPAKRAAILRWLRHPDPATGKPRLGTPPPPVPPAAKEAVLGAAAAAAPADPKLRRLFLMKSGLDLQQE
jgi:hypothetical protein